MAARSEEMAHAVCDAAAVFDVPIERHFLGIEESLQRPDLVNQTVRQFFWRHFHLSAAETLKVGKRRVGTDLDVVLLR